MIDMDNSKARDLEFEQAARLHDEALEIMRDDNASLEARRAASYCIQLFVAFARQRLELRRLEDQERRRRHRSRSGFVRQITELPPEAMPPSLRDVPGTIVEYSTGHPLIYFLLAGDEVVYVGKTLGIDARLASHLCSGKTFDRVLVMPVARSTLDATERELIKRLRPRLNNAGIPVWERIRRRRAPIEPAAPEGSE